MRAKEIGNFVKYLLLIYAMSDYKKDGKEDNCDSTMHSRMKQRLYSRVSHPGRNARCACEFMSLPPMALNMLGEFNIAVRYRKGERNAGIIGKITPVYDALCILLARSRS